MSLFSEETSRDWIGGQKLLTQTCMGVTVLGMGTYPSVRLAKAKYFR